MWAPPLRALGLRLPIHAGAVTANNHGPLCLNDDILSQAIDEDSDGDGAAAEEGDRSRAVRAAEHAGVAAELLRAKSCDRALEPLRPYVTAEVHGGAFAGAARSLNKSRSLRSP